MHHLLFTTKIKAVEKAIKNEIKVSTIQFNIKLIWDDSTFMQRITLLTYLAGDWRAHHNFTTDGMLYELAQQSVEGQKTTTRPLGFSPLIAPKRVN